MPDAQLNYLTIWPAGQQQPHVSTLNSDGRIKANAAIVPAGANGAVSVYATDNTQVILDIDGYSRPSAHLQPLRCIRWFHAESPIPVKGVRPSERLPSSVARAARSRCLEAVATSQRPHKPIR